MMNRFAKYFRSGEIAKLDEHELIRLVAPVFRKDLILVGVRRNRGPTAFKRPWVGIYLTWEQLRSHCGIFGATGRGKTVMLTLISVQCVWNGWPMVLMDQKCDHGLIRAIWVAAVMCGRAGVDPDNPMGDFQLFSPYAVEKPSGMLGRMGTCSWNPIAGIDSAMSLVNSFVNAGRKEGGQSNQFYEEVKESNVSTVVNAILSTNKPAMFEDYGAVMGNIEGLQILREKSKDIRANMIITEWLQILQGKDFMAQQNLNKQFQGAKMFFEDLSKPPFDRLMGTCKPDITMRRTHTEKKITIFVLPVQSLQHTARQIARLVLSELGYLSGSLQAEGEDRIPFPVIVDEAYAVSTLELTVLLSMARSSGMVFFLVYQALAQMSKAVDKDFKEILLSNMVTKISFAAAEVEQAKNLSEMIGHDDTKISTRIGDETEAKAETYKISPTKIMKQAPFEAVFVTPDKTYRGYVPNIPTKWNVGSVDTGVAIGRPYFEPTITKEGGIGIWERIAAQQR